MKERLLFHLRLGDSSSPRLARRKSLIGAERASIWSTPSLLQDDGSGAIATEEEPPLECTCVHSSLSCAVAVGFKRGVVHVYHRQEGVGVPGRGRRGSEEEKWKRSVLYPTRSLGGVAASPIESPSSTMPPDITCVAIAPGEDRLAVGTSDGFVFVTQAPPPPSDSTCPGGSTGWARGAGFHHKSHRGKRINCLLWDNSGDQLYSVCEGGTVVLARNLQPRRGAPAVGVAGITGVMQFLGVHHPVQAASRSEPVLPQAIIVGQVGSSGVSLDLGRTDAALPGSTRRYVECDILLVMTRKRAVLLYFAVGEDVSAIAPHQTCVDLNVIEHPPAADDLGPPGTSSGSGSGSGSGRSCAPPPPPARTDFGACLWGPPQLPCVGRDTLSGGGDSAWRNARGGDRTPNKRRNSTSESPPAPRPVLFAYVAQPGGRLWRIGLSDGEVESMHRPPVEIDEDMEERGVAAESGVELGHLRAVDVGDARALLCWRSGVQFKTGGEFALLDPNTHRFVAAFSGASDIVDVSGFVLSPCSRSEGCALFLEAARPLMTSRSLEVLAGGVRVLHGGDLAKVKMLFHNAEGETWSSCSSEVTDGWGWGAALSAEAAARRVQRAWRAARQRRITAAAVAAKVTPAGAASPPAVSRVSPRTLRMPGEFSRAPTTGATCSPVEERRHSASAADTADAEAGGFQAGGPAKASAIASSRRRKRQGWGSNRMPESLRGEDSGGGGDGARRKTSRSRSAFSVRDSIEALDAADRALELSSRPARSSSNVGEGQNEDWQRWTGDRVSPGTINAGHGGKGAEGELVGELGNAGELLSGSDSDGAGAMCRATDALIRETWPVLQRTRSLEDFQSSSDSLSLCKSPASFPPDRRSGARAAATRVAIAPETGRNRQERTEELHVEEAAGALMAGTERAREGGSRNNRWEENAESLAAAISASPPGGSPFPTSTGSKGRSDETDEADRRMRGPRTRSSSAHEADGFGPRSTSTRSNTPFPRDQVEGELGDGSEGVPHQPARSSFPRQQPPKQSRKKHSPGTQQGNLFGLGTLLQRSVQAVNDALQPGGGATSDDDSLQEGGEDAAMFAGQYSGGSSGGGFSSGNELHDDGDGAGADGGTTSETGKESWGASSDRSELDGSLTTTMRLSNGANQDVDSDKLFVGSKTRRRTSDAGGFGGGEGDDYSHRKGEGSGSGQKRGRSMLFVSGMMGVKRHCLGTLRSRREARVRPNLATVMDLPSSAMDDPNPFVPPSQYEVRLNVSRGLGMSLNITGNSVRVKGFSTVQGAQIGPAQACGEIQVGDTLVCVNHERLSLLNHDNVVRVLRGLLNTSGSQVVLLRFAYAEDSQRLLQARSPPPPPPLPPPPLPPQTPKSARNLSLGNPKSEPRVSQGPRGSTEVEEVEEETFRPESWHGSRQPVTKGKGEGVGAERDAARSVSPSRTGGAARERSHSLGGRESSPATFARAKSGSGAGQGGRVWAGGRGWSGWTVADGVGGMRPKGRRAGELWGERETGFGGSDSGSRHVFLADMGHAKAQRMLQSIAEDVQGLYEVRRSSEESRYFHGRSRPSFADPSPASLEYRVPPPSTLLAASKTTAGGPSPSVAPASLLDGLSGSVGIEAPPPLPRELYRGRRRRRPRRRRSSFLDTSLAGGSGSVASGGEGDKAEEVSIDLLSCQEVVQAEIGRLNGELERQRARLARRSRRSTTRSLVAKMLHRNSSSAEGGSLSFAASASPTALAGRGGGRRGRRRGYVCGTRGGGGSTWRNGTAGRQSGGGGTWDEEGSDIALTDSDISDVAPNAAKAATAAVATAVGDEVGMGQERTAAGDGGEGFASASVAEEGEEGACDLFLEAVSTGGLQEELLANHAVEVLAIDPPKPLPAAAYDLQTALESVQHFATQTLAGVVQSEAIKGSDLYDTFSGARSPRQTSSGWKAATVAAKENREAAAAAGAVEGWEVAWPPRELTAALGLVTARQMAHAMRCDAEPLIQVWMRCFTPVNVKHRAKLWEGLSPPPLHSHDLHLEAGRWHRQLVCGLVTLFAQVHISWPFLARPSDDPGAVGLLSLRLETTWFSSTTMDDAGAGTDTGVHSGLGDVAGESPSSEGGGSTSCCSEEWGQASGGRKGPMQWDEEKTVDFIQDYGAYLEADALAAAASCREMEWALQEVLDLAQQCGDYKLKERTLHHLLRGPRTPSVSSMSVLRSPTLRLPNIGTTPLARSPTNSVSTAGTRTPGTWTPNIMSPTSPAFPSRSVSAGAASAGKGGGGVGSGALSGALEAASSGPVEEDAVRKALGLLPVGSDELGKPAGDVREDRRRHRASSLEDAGGGNGSGSCGFGLREGGDASQRVSETHQAPGGAPLCLLLRNLGELFRWDAAAAADICADAFPGIRPWNVHHALQQEQERPWTASQPATPVQQGGGGAGSGRHHSFVTGDDNGTRNDAAFHAYLWAMMQKHPRECRKDWKVVQRCIQLSLRLSSKLRSLPLDHPLQDFCMAVARNFSGGQPTVDPATAGGDGRGVGNIEAFPFEARNHFSSPADGQRRQGAGSVSRIGGLAGMRDTRDMRDMRLGGDESGHSYDYLAWRRYGDVVKEVVSLWCQDADAFDLDPLWLLSKLRTHKSWHAALQVCGAVTCLWEESEEQRSSESGFGLTLAVFDTLADASFVSFNDGDTDTLASALGAMWAADGALRRFFSCEKWGPYEGGGGGSVSPGAATLTSSSPSLAAGDGPSSLESRDAENGATGPGFARRPSMESRSDTGSGIARGDGFGWDFAGATSRYETITDWTQWTQESRMVDVVRSLAQRCRGLPTRIEETDASDGADAGDGDRAGSSTGGIGASMRSEEEPGLRASWPPGALSLLELAETVLNAVGPEATGDVLAACPQLLENMPPEFFRELADRQAMACQQQALEATLLRQATAEVWCARGTQTTTSAFGRGDGGAGAGAGGGGGDDGMMLSPLGPRLAWLACEELTSFFQHSVNAATNARLRGGHGLTSPAGGAPSPGLLQNFMPRSRLATPAGAGHLGGALPSHENSSVFSVYGGGSGGEEGGDFEPPRKEQLVKQAVATMGLNLILPGSAHRGSSFEAYSPCGFCDLPLSGDPSIGDSVASASAYGGGRSMEEDAGLVVKACGHGFHARCLLESGPHRPRDGGEVRTLWFEEVGSSFSPCLRCCSYQGKSQ
ncbi:unnamed protein product [Scytosiphon promiscuus]